MQYSTVQYSTGYSVPTYLGQSYIYCSGRARAVKGSEIRYRVGGGGNQGRRLYREAGYIYWSCSRKEYLSRRGDLLGRDSREQEQERDSWSSSEYLSRTRNWYKLVKKFYLIILKTVI